MNRPGGRPGLLQRFASAPAARRVLVCFPSAGGTEAIFAGWRSGLAPHTEVVTVRYPSNPVDLVELAEVLARRIRVLPRTPVTLLGHSMGALVAYETARCLAPLGEFVGGLLVSACAAPQEHRPRFGVRSDRELLAELGELGGTDERLLAEPVFRDTWLPAVRRDFAMLDAYRHTDRGQLRCPVTAFAGRADRHAPPSSMRRWSEATTGSFAMRVFPGEHFYLVAQRMPVISEIAAMSTSGSQRSTP